MEGCASNTGECCKLRSAPLPHEMLRIAKVKTAIAGHRQWLTTLRLRSSRTSTRYAR